MTATVEQLQSEWRKLIDLAQQGEEVMLSSKGQVVARLTGVQGRMPPKDRKSWLSDLARLREQTATGKACPATETILEDIRSERG
jgi:antitoxin (DNA-binding transcriptional repressor) of toxin-antitoxin stability system